VKTLQRLPTRLRTALLTGLLTLVVATLDANDVKEGLLLIHEEAITAREDALKEIERRAAIETKRLQAWLNLL
jgi:hypothetical protein